MKTLKFLLLALAVIAFASCSKSSVAPTVQPTVTVSYTKDTINKVYVLTAIVTDPSHVSTGGQWQIESFVNNETYWSNLGTTDTNGVYTATIGYEGTFSGYFLGGVNGIATVECMFKLEKGSEALTEPQVFPPVDVQ